MPTSRFPGGGGGVESVTGLNTNNADPANPVVRISVDGTSITGAGTQASKLAQYVTPVADGNSGASKTIDWGSSPVATHTLTLTGNVTLTLSNPVTGGKYIMVISTGAGSFTPVWPDAANFPDDTPPDLTTASEKWLVTLLYDGTIYLCSFNGPYSLS